MTNVRLNPAEIVGQLAELRFVDVFNPYADVCAEYDTGDAPAIRRNNLRLTLEQASKGIDELWLALEPGHRGARRTGLAMTDDARLAMHAEYWKIAGLSRATNSGPETEATAGIVWEALTSKPASVFLWNAFPLHSHLTGSPFSNRRHTRYEREQCEAVTSAIFKLLKPGRIFAIGKEAHLATVAMGIDASPVRHPSFGGKKQFMEGICKV